MQLIDTHCHIHSRDYPLNPVDVIADAIDQSVYRLICVGTDLEDSQIAVRFVNGYKNTWASIGIHPHESWHYVDKKSDLAKFEKLASGDKVVAIGECGLDYYYDHSNKFDQKQILEFQLSVAQKHNLPAIFHVRDAFDDFWPILDSFKNIRGVIHSFTANNQVLDQALSRGLYIGLNGIMTFSKNPSQLEAAKNIPIDKLLLETDSPYLTPAPFRGTICQPKHVCVTAEFIAKLRNETIENLAERTSGNANKLFNLEETNAK